MDERKDMTFSLSLGRSPAELDSARISLRDFLAGSGVGEDSTAAMELSVYEVLVNIIDHSPETVEEEMISLSCRVTERSLDAEISHHGDEFDITRRPLPDIPAHARSGSKRGLGVYIIRTLMDSVEYSYSENLNTVKLSLFR